MRTIEQQQINELTEYHIYSQLAEIWQDNQNKSTLLQIAQEELSHYNYWKSITQKDVSPNRFRIKWHILLAKVFGLAFSLRLMEMGEDEAKKFYASLKGKYPGIEKIEQDEIAHEQKLIGILNDKRLNYAGSIVLGLNDALVEFTGTLAGLTFAFNNNLLVGTTGLVMGLAASMSMAASGYLSSREEGDVHENINPVTAAIYTGVSYLMTVAILVLPYLIQDNPRIAVSLMLVFTVLIIAAYTYYISVAKSVSFKSRFGEMVLISLGVAAISYGIGLLIKHLFGIEV